MPNRVTVEPGGLGHVREGAVAVVAVEGERRRRASGLFVPWPEAGIDKEHVLPAVVVEVQEGDAGAHRLGQQLLAEGAVGVPEVDAGLLGDIA